MLDTKWGWRGFMTQCSVASIMIQCISLPPDTLSRLSVLASSPSSVVPFLLFTKPFCEQDQSTGTQERLFLHTRLLFNQFYWIGLLYSPETSCWHDLEDSNLGEGAAGDGQVMLALVGAATQKTACTPTLTSTFAISAFTCYTSWKYTMLIWHEISSIIWFQGQPKLVFSSGCVYSLPFLFPFPTPSSRSWTPGLKSWQKGSQWWQIPLT